MYTFQYKISYPNIKNLMNIYINIHKMKITMNFTYIFLVALFILLITVSISRSCVQFKPYSENNIFSKQFPFEAMTNNNDMINNDQLSPVTSPSIFLSPVSNMNTQELLNQLSPVANNEINISESFSNLNSSPYISTEKNIQIDIFSGTPGSLDCNSKSSNLTNSKGGLCLTQTQINLLKTRGGNASGGDAQIGK